MQFTKCKLIVKLFHPLILLLFQYVLLATIILNFSQ